MKYILVEVLLEGNQEESAEFLRETILDYMVEKDIKGNVTVSETTDEEILAEIGEVATPENSGDQIDRNDPESIRFDHPREDKSYD